MENFSSPFFVLNTLMKKQLSKSAKAKQKKLLKKQREEKKQASLEQYTLGDTGYGHWKLAPGLEFNSQAMGFLYLIEGIIDGKIVKYIGKKQMVSIGRKKSKESDWKEYTSSSSYINEAIAKNGKQSFSFTILEFGFSKSHLAYIEAREQFIRNVFLDDDYVNGIINCRIGKSPVLMKNLRGQNEKTIILERKKV